MFEIELIKQVEITVDYILMLVEKYTATHGDGQDKEIRVEISRAVDASPTLRSKKDLIEAFVDSVSARTDVEDEWQRFIASRRDQELDDIIAAENLQPDRARSFMAKAFREGALTTSGTALTKVIPPASRFVADNGYAERKARVVGELTAFFERFFGLAKVGQ